MRLLHQVRAHERLLAKGVYVGAAGGREEWVWNELPDGAQLLRVDAVGSLRELYFTVAGELARVDWLKFAPGAAAESMVRSTVSYFSESAHFGQQYGGGERRYREWPLERDCLRAPPALAALGLLAREIGAAGGVALVFSLREEERGLHGENHRWRAAEIKHTSWRLSREDGAEWRLTLDAHGIPQHIDGADGDDAWQLRDYLHRSTRR